MSQFLFFFQAEDGIRDGHVTGVQTCALPIYDHRSADLLDEGADVIRGLPHCALAGGEQLSGRLPKIGRASCRERMETAVVVSSLMKRVLTITSVDLDNLTRIRASRRRVGRD